MSPSAPPVDRANQLLADLDRRREGLIALLAELVRAPSPNPPGDERAAAAVVTDFLTANGWAPPTVVAAAPERPNLVFRLPGAGGGPTLLLNGHLDTKPADAAAWSGDPLQPAIRGDRLYGLGATDMKGGVAAIAMAGAALAGLDPPLRGDLLLVFTADEEATTGLGARYLVEHFPLAADAGLVAEPAGLAHDWEVLPLYARAPFYFIVRVYGTQAHASISDRFPNVNASVKMAWVLQRLARGLRFTHEPDPYSPLGPTVTPGVLVRGGVNFGVHPGEAEFAVDVRMTLGMTREGAVADVERFLDGLRAEDPELRVELEVVGAGQIHRVDPGHPFVVALGAAVERVLGKRPPFGAFPAVSDAATFHGRLGIPTVPAFGPGLLPLAHAADEWVSLRAVSEAARIYALAAATYLDARAAAEPSQPLDGPGSDR